MKIKGLETKLERIKAIRTVCLVVSIAMFLVIRAYPMEDIRSGVLSLCTSIFFLVLFVYFNSEVRHIQLMEEIRKK